MATKTTKASKKRGIIKHRKWRVRNDTINTTTKSGALGSPGMPDMSQRVPRFMTKLMLMQSRAGQGVNPEDTERFNIEPAWPQGGMVSRPMAERNWSVQAYTGYPVSRLPYAGFHRGSLIRGETPVVSLNPIGAYQYDPTLSINPGTN